MASRQEKKPRTSQSSFTLIETIIALGLMTVIVLEVSAVQGRAISFATYERKVTQATWLAKAIMAQIEYKWKFYDLKEIKASEKESKFPTELCSDDPNFDCNYKYSISIEKWDLPLVDMAAASIGDDMVAGLVKEQMKNIFGEDVLKVAHVEVSWPEGSRKDSVELAYLLTGQQQLDANVETLQPVGVAAGGGKTGTDPTTTDQTKNQNPNKVPPPQNPNDKAGPSPNDGGDN